MCILFIYWYISYVHQFLCTCWSLCVSDSLGCFHTCHFIRNLIANHLFILKRLNFLLIYLSFHFMTCMCKQCFYYLLNSYFSRKFFLELKRNFPLFELLYQIFFASQYVSFVSPVFLFVIWYAISWLFSLTLILRISN